MDDTQLCRSMLNAIAGTSCPASCGAVAIHPLQLILLWDDRPEASCSSLNATAAAFGQVVAFAADDRGPNGRMISGALIRPHAAALADATALDHAAAALRVRHFHSPGDGTVRPAIVSVAASHHQPKVKPRRRAS